VSCTANHLYDGASPVCLILSDQNFPPALPAIEGQCCVIIRAEDCLLSELPGMLKEYFGGLPGCLPEGSMVMFGSLSHLAKRGLKNYAEECVKIKKVIMNMLPGSCTVIHMVFVPLGGIEGEATIRDLYNLDSWPDIAEKTCGFRAQSSGHCALTDRYRNPTVMAHEYCICRNRSRQARKYARWPALRT
jgi:hypothetical protein